MNTPANQSIDEKLDTLLRIIRDAGAEDDNHGAEDWTFSDSKIVEAKQSIKQLITEARIESLIHGKLELK